MPRSTRCAQGSRERVHVAGYVRGTDGHRPQFAIADRRTRNTDQRCEGAEFGCGVLDTRRLPGTQCREVCLTARDGPHLRRGGDGHRQQQPELRKLLFQWVEPLVRFLVTA